MVLELIFGDIQYQFNQNSKDLASQIKTMSSQDMQSAISNIAQDVDKQIATLLNSSSEQFVSEFEKTLPPFTEKITMFSDLLLQITGGNLAKAFDSDKYAFNLAIGSIKKNVDQIGQERSEQIISILTKWIDYTTILIVNLARNVSQVTLALKEIDSQELANNNMGTLVSLACIFKLFRTGQLEHENFETVLKLGIKYSDILESYADTIDILCNPKERELIKNIDDQHV